jgi:YD repeat-containing protein
MKSRAISFFTLLALTVTGCAGWSVAQDPDDIQQGIKAYGTYRGGDIDSTSMTNGNLTVHIPLVSYPQRGKLDLGYKLVYNGKNYKQKTTCQADICTTYVDRISLGSPLLAVPSSAFTTKVTSVQYEGTTEIVEWTSLVGTDGASHILASFSSTGSGESETVDGTGLQYYNSASGFATDTNGTRYSGADTQEDANGNNFTMPGLDTVGRTIPYFPVVSGSGGSGSCPTGPLPVDSNAQWAGPGPNSGTSTFLFCWAQVNVVQSYNITDGTETYANVDFLQSVVLPNGTAWTFQYSNDGFGDLTEITFPTGGTISYVWENGASCSGMLIPPRWLASRTVNANDGTGSHTWTYSYNGTINTATVADPLGNNTVYTNSFLSYCSAYTTQVQYYEGAVSSANLIKTVSTAFSTTASPFAQYLGDTFMNIVPTQITTTWAANGKTSQVTKSYDSGFTFPSPRPDDSTVYTGLYGKVLVEKDYDYGTSSGVPGPLLKQTNTSYAWQSPNPNNATYLANNMLNLVYSTQITDGTNQKAFTQYGYDETATIPYTPPPGNLDTSVWTGTLRGNTTSVNRWLNLPTVQTLTSKTTYYVTGMPSVAKDPLLNPTTYFYSSTFQDAYVTQVENALSQSIYYNYDYDTGLKTSTTDLNGQITTDSYDVDWRLLSDIRPTVVEKLHSATPTWVVPLVPRAAHRIKSLSLRKSQRQGSTRLPPPLWMDWDGLPRLN